MNTKNADQSQVKTAGQFQAEISKDQKDLLVKQYDAIKTVAQARLDLANVRADLARAGAFHLIAMDW